MEDWNTSLPNVNVLNNTKDRPSAVYRFLQFILIYDEHNAVVGATNMNDIIWNGILRQYNISDFNKATVTKQMNHGVCDAAYLTQDKFVVGGDAGDIEIFQIVETVNEQQLKDFQSLHCVSQHNSSVLAVAAFSDENIVTGGMDGCIKIWDTKNLFPTFSFDIAHIEAITSICVKPMCNTIFVSTDHSGEALLWDIRKSKPAHCLLNTEFQLSTVTWRTASDHFIAIGGDDGIALMDTRLHNKPIYFQPMKIGHDRNVHKLLFNPNPERKEQLACCFDGTPVKVFDFSKKVYQIYEDNTHTDFVQGLAWYKDDLFSCSWDGNVIKHVISCND